jgi:hypothetical protein
MALVFCPQMSPHSGSLRARPRVIATILPSDQLWLTPTRERCRGVVFNGRPRALDRKHYTTLLDFSRRGGSAPHTRFQLRRGIFWGRGRAAFFVARGAAH